MSARLLGLRALTGLRDSGLSDRALSACAASCNVQRPSLLWPGQTAILTTSAAVLSPAQHAAVTQSTASPPPPAEAVSRTAFSTAALAVSAYAAALPPPTVLLRCPSQSCPSATIGVWRVTYSACFTAQHMACRSVAQLRNGERWDAALALI